jgi:hypothetical protein
MWKEIAAATALSTALAITPAIAQQTQEGQMGTEQETQQMQGQQETQQMQGQQPTPQGQAQYQGWPVFSSDGEKIGEVVEVMPGDAGQEQKLIVQSEGFLGIGAKRMEVQGNQYQAAQNRIELQMTAEEAQDLPESAS